MKQFLKSESARSAEVFLTFAATYRQLSSHVTTENEPTRHPVWRGVRLVCPFDRVFIFT